MENGISAANVQFMSGSGRETMQSRAGKIDRGQNRNTEQATATREGEGGKEGRGGESSGCNFIVRMLAGKVNFIGGSSDDCT